MKRLRSLWIFLGFFVTPVFTLSANALGDPKCLSIEEMRQVASQFSENLIGGSSPAGQSQKSSAVSDSSETQSWQQVIQMGQAAVFVRLKF